MIEGHTGKRDTAFAAWIIFVFLTPLVLSLKALGLEAPPLFGYALIWCVFFGFISWFAAHYYWSRAKGYSGWLTFLALLGFPIATMVFACLKDRAKVPPSPDDPIQRCPQCGAKYRRGEYNPSAERILCSSCKEELPRAEGERYTPGGTS